MGGNLFKKGRISREQYLKIEAELIPYLKQKFGTKFAIPRYYADKEDFGDMDIILSEALFEEKSFQEIKEEIRTDLSITESKSTGKVFSTLYKNFQVDFFTCPADSFKMMWAYLSFNDIGNLIGKIFKRFNLKYGEMGLFYVYRGDSLSYVRDHRLSSDVSQIFSFIELNFTQWEKGFTSKEEMFKWVIASPYFSVEPYIKQDKTIKKRAKNRPIMQAFLEFIEINEIHKTYSFLENKGKYIPQIDSFFPDAKLLEFIKSEDEKVARMKVVREKFNGDIVMSLIPNLSGKELGLFIRDFKASFDNFDAEVAPLSSNEIAKMITEFYVKYENQT